MQDNDKTKAQLIEELNELRQQLAARHNLEAEYGQAMAELRYTETQNRAILRALPDLMFRLSKEGIHIDFHSANLENLFVQPEDFVGKTIEEVLPPETAQKYRHFINETLLTNQEQYFEYDLDFATTGRTYYEARMVVIDADEVLVMVRDITDRKQLQQEQQKAELLRIKLEEQQELVRLKERFVSLVTHEFRTPLAVISTNLHLLSNFADRLDAERRAYKFEVINKNIMHLSELIDQVLMVGHAQSGKLVFKPKSIQLASFCREIFEQIKDTDSGLHQFEFENQIPDMDIMLDEGIMQHVLSNLLSNAVKYSPDGGPINLTINRIENTILITVADSGIGISEADQAHIFESFYRAENVGRIHGTGLGLFITNQLVTLHGGNIEVESNVGQGSTFTVRLPLN